MKASICIATKNKEAYLDKVLTSIQAQNPPFDFEVIVVDDGSDDDTKSVCLRHHVDKYIRLDNPLEWRNPSVARNVAYRAARGEVIIAQSDDVIHCGLQTIRLLVERLNPGWINIAEVWNYKDGVRDIQYTGLRNRRPLFFLGSLLREHVYKIGGNDEDFVKPGSDDVWFGDCLTKGLGLKVHYMTDVKGLHLDHPRPQMNQGWLNESKRLYRHKVSLARSGAGPWATKEAPWPFEEGKPLNEA